MGLLPMGADILPPSDDRVFKLILTSPEPMSISQSERERAIFRSRRKFQTDLQSDLATAEDNGERRGRTERSIEIARNLFNVTFSVEIFFFHC